MTQLPKSDLTLVETNQNTMSAIYAQIVLLIIVQVFMNHFWYQTIEDLKIVHQWIVIDISWEGPFQFGILIH